MRSDCIEAVARSLGRQPTAPEIRGIEGRLTEAVRANARDNRDVTAKQTPSERLSSAADRVAKELVAEKSRQVRNVSKQIIAHDRNAQFIEKYGQQLGGYMNAVRRLLADNIDAKTNVRSLEQRRHGIARLYNGKLGPVVEATQKYLGFWTDKKSVRDVLRELYGEDSGNVVAKKAALAWRDNIADPLHEQFNESGAAVKKRDDWAAPQSHSQARVAKAGEAQWIADVLPKLKRDNYVNTDGSLMNDAQMNELLHHAYDSISTDGANKIEPGRPQGLGAVKNRGQNERVLHFKDADSYLDYQAKYGERSLLETMVSHIQTMAKNIATLDTFGPNGEAGFRQLADAAYQKDVLADRTKIGKLDGARSKLDTQFALSSGKAGPMANPSLAHKFDIAKTLMVLPKLGSATFSAVTDGTNVRMVSRAWRIPASQQFLYTLKSWGSADFRQTMRAQGIGVENVTHAISRYGEETFGHGMPSVVANTLFRVSGLNFIDGVRRTSTGAMLMRKLGDLTQAHESLADMHGLDRRLLESRGVTDATWSIWKQAELTDGMLTPDGIQKVQGVSDFVKRDAMQNLIGSIFMDEGTVVPMMKDWARGDVNHTLGAAKRGTWGGELVNSILQFKSFPIAMMYNHWQRLQSMPTPTGKALYAVELAVTATIYGALSVQMHSLAFGQNPQDMTDPKFAARAFIQGGAAGILGDLIGNAIVSPYREKLTDMLGPTVGTATSIFDIAHSAIDASKDQSKRDKLGDDIVRFGKGMTPFANLWYTKAAIDHLFFQRLQDYYSPGYAARSMERAKTNFGTTPWWKPSTAAAPSQLLTSKGITSPQSPDLETALGKHR